MHCLSWCPVMTPTGDVNLVVIKDSYINWLVGISNASTKS